MIVFYDKDGKIMEVEHNVMHPTFSDDFELQDIIDDAKDRGLKFVALPYEIDDAILSYKVVTNDSQDFLALEPVEKE